MNKELKEELVKQLTKTMTLTRTSNKQTTLGHWDQICCKRIDT